MITSIPKFRFVEPKYRYFDSGGGYVLVVDVEAELGYPYSYINEVWLPVLWQASSVYDMGYKELTEAEALDLCKLTAFPSREGVNFT